ncbi:MAG: radical SAM protein [Tissierellia bacterium]|nr:radical SAM protein [Tissierellia bacterium]
MDLLYSRDTIYRPITEENSVFLEVQQGCSYGGCAFCDFGKDEYRVFSLDDIATKIHLLKEIYTDEKRMFLLGQNALALQRNYLEHIFKMVKKHMPNIEEFAMYGRADDVLRKNEADLKRLMNLGLKELHIGLESGSDEVLHQMNKKITRKEYQKAFHLLDKLDLDYSITIIPGLGGKEGRDDHIEMTAKMINEIHPKLIWALDLYIWPGTKLKEMVERGEFQPMDPMEMAEEQIYLMDRIHKNEKCFYLNTTYMGFYTLFGELSRGKNRLYAMMMKLYRQDEDIIIGR